MGKVKIYPIYITMNFYFHKTVHVKKWAICVSMKNSFCSGNSAIDIRSASPDAANGRAFCVYTKSGFQASETAFVYHHMKADSNEILHSVHRISNTAQLSHRALRSADYDCSNKPDGEALPHLHYQSYCHNRPPEAKRSQFVIRMLI